MTTPASNVTPNDSSASSSAVVFTNRASTSDSDNSSIGAAAGLSVFFTAFMNALTMLNQLQGYFAEIGVQLANNQAALGTQSSQNEQKFYEDNIQDLVDKLDSGNASQYGPEISAYQAALNSMQSADQAAQKNLDSPIQTVTQQTQAISQAQQTNISAAGPILQVLQFLASLLSKGS